MTESVKDLTPLDKLTLDAQFEKEATPVRPKKMCSCLPDKEPQIKPPEVPITHVLSLLKPKFRVYMVSEVMTLTRGLGGEVILFE